MPTLLDTSVAQKITNRFEQLNRAFKRLTEEEAALLFPPMTALLAELKRRGVRPAPFRERWLPCANQLGLDTKRLRDCPPDPRIAKLCTQEFLRRHMVYPLSLPLSDGAEGLVVVGCHPYYAGQDGAVELHDHLEQRSRVAGGPVLFSVPMLYGQFEEAEIREALAKNIHLFASE